MQDRPVVGGEEMIAQGVARKNVPTAIYFHWKGQMERRAAQSHKPAQMCDLECVWPVPGIQHCDSNLRHRSTDQYQFNFMTLTSRISKI